MTLSVTIKTAIKALIWNAVFILAGILIIELLYGSWFSSNSLNNLNILRNRTWHYDFSYPGIPDQERNIVYSRDQWGLRGNYGDPNDIDVLTIGGSTTDQRYISDGYTWQDILSENFNNKGKPINIANAGIDGRTTFGHQYDFNLWFPKIDQLHPDYILFYVGINDMFFSHENNRFDEPYSRTQSLKLILKGNSAIYKLLRSLLGTYLVLKRNIGHTTIDYQNAEWSDIAMQSNYQAKLKYRLEGFSSRLSHLLKKAKEMGATPIVVSQPRGDSRFINGRIVGIVNAFPRGGSAFKDSALGELNSQTANGVDYYQILSLFNTISLQLCEQYDGVCIDLAKQLRFEDGDFYDHAHNTRQGAKKIGDFLYAKLNNKIPSQEDSTSR